MSRIALLTTQQRGVARHAEVLRRANMPWAAIIERLDPVGKGKPPLRDWMLRRWIRQMHTEDARYSR